MLLPGPRVSHGSLYGPPIAAVSIATLCHVLPLSGLLTLLVCSIFCHRVLADYGPPHSCCQAPNLPWALYRLLMGLLLPGPTVSHHAMCHFQVSSHCWCVPFFVIGCWQITGLP
ncbi:unnamed protein product [Staurois parvus]|uniref:Uncharacterized protein n=1 Tax=Staurois parvus TaxID=386267 RepID=A0ABN9B262_9NEOB|nr:unnamed protein product [Staurois parvus]